MMRVAGAAGGAAAGGAGARCVGAGAASVRRVVAATVLMRRFASAASSSSASGSGVRVGFIGLGNMGGHMAHNLLKAGHSLVVYDVNASAMDQLKQRGQTYGREVSIAQVPADVTASDCAVVFTMLPSSPHVLSVYTDPKTGLLSTARQGTLLIDSSTIDPGTARQVSHAAAVKGVRMIDAPVSGGVGGAEAATLTFMVGAPDATFEEAKTYLTKLGRNIVHCGDVGTGQVAKVCNNLVLAVNMAAVSEAMNLGVQQGMDAKTLAGIFNTSSARCWASDTYSPVPDVMPNVPSSRQYAGGFGSTLMLKDLGLAALAAKQIGVDLPVGGVVEQLYRTMCKDPTYAPKDFSVIYQYFKEHLSGTASTKK